MTNQELNKVVAEVMGIRVEEGWVDDATYPSVYLDTGFIPKSSQPLPPRKVPIYLRCKGHGYWKPSGEASLKGHYGVCYVVLPNWAEDLSACMAPDGPWRWLIEQVKPWGGSVDLETTIAPPQSYGEGDIGYRCAVYTYPDDFLGEGLGEMGSQAICRAVLAVKGKLDNES